jgi:hypothetical protein
LDNLHVVRHKEGNDMLRSATLLAFSLVFLIIGTAFADDPRISISPTQPRSGQENQQRGNQPGTSNHRLRSTNVPRSSYPGSQNVVGNQKQRATDYDASKAAYEKRRQEYEKQKQAYEKRKKEVEEYNARVRKENAETEEYNAQMQAQAARQRQGGSGQSKSSDFKPYLVGEPGYGSGDGDLPDWMRSPVVRGWDYSHPGPQGQE